MSDVNKTKKGNHILIQLSLVVLIIGAGIGLMNLLKGMRQDPERIEPVVIRPLVEAFEARVVDAVMEIEGYGNAKAKYEAQISSQVAGKIVRDNLLKGKIFNVGEELIKIDPKDYELAVQMARAELASAKVQVEQEEAESQVAKTEWYEMNPDREPDSPLLFRGPQIAEAKARLLSAESKLDKAKLDLERTSISLPFDGMVTEESASVGQYVQVGEDLGSAYDVSIVEIEIPLEDKELKWFSIGEDGSEAIVSAYFGGKERIWYGKVERTAGQIDRKTRMADVIIEVVNPSGVVGGDMSLSPGVFVDVRIQGRELSDVVAVPRSAIHDHSQVWVSVNGKLEIREVGVARSGRDFSYVTEGINNGDVIVLSNIEAVVEGMGIDVEMVENPYDKQ